MILSSRNHLSLCLNCVLLWSLPSDFSMVLYVFAPNELFFNSRWLRQKDQPDQICFNRNDDWARVGNHCNVDTERCYISAILVVLLEDHVIFIRGRAISEIRRSEASRNSTWRKKTSSWITTAYQSPENTFHNEISSSTVNRCIICVSVIDVHRNPFPFIHQMSICVEGEIDASIRIEGTSGRGDANDIGVAFLGRSTKEFRTRKTIIARTCKFQFRQHMSRMKSAKYISNLTVLFFHEGFNNSFQWNQFDCI